PVEVAVGAVESSAPTGLGARGDVADRHGQPRSRTMTSRVPVSTMPYRSSPMRSTENTPPPATRNPLATDTSGPPTYRVVDCELFCTATDFGTVAAPPRARAVGVSLTVMERDFMS